MGQFFIWSKIKILLGNVINNAIEIMQNLLVIIQKVLLSNHQKFWLTWLINQNLFCLRYRQCSIQVERHCLGEVREELLPNNDCWEGAPDTLPQEKVCQHETGWGYCAVVRGGKLLQSHKSCQRRSSRLKSLRCCSGSCIWWRYDEIWAGTSGFERLMTHHSTAQPNYITPRLHGSIFKHKISRSNQDLESCSKFSFEIMFHMFIISVYYIKNKCM